MMAESFAFGFRAGVVVLVLWFVVAVPVALGAGVALKRARKRLSRHVRD